MPLSLKAIAKMCFIAAKKSAKTAHITELFNMKEISKTKKTLFLMLWLCLFTADIARGEPLVIRDYGGRDSGVPNKNSITKLAQQYSVKPHVIDKAERYPLRSGLHPGYVNKPQALREPVK